MFLSYESVFLYLWAWDAGLIEGPADDAPTCCRLRRCRDKPDEVESEVARFCGALGLLLGSIKLEDDIRDEGSLAARLAHWKLRPRLERARRYFLQLDPEFPQRVAGYIRAHLERERTGSRVALSDYATPTAEAFGYLFSLFGNRFAGKRGAQATGLCGAGRDLGRAIIAYDCAVDWNNDRRRGSYNPLRYRGQVDRALLYAQSCLVSAGWQAQERFGAGCRTAEVVGGVFRRLTSTAHALSGAPVSRRAKSDRHPARRRWSLRRRGDCDCGCDPGCCEGCCADGGPCAGGADGGCSDHHAIVCCCPCEFVDCCWWGQSGSSRRRNEQAKAAVAKDDNSLIGMVGTTATPLKPTGVIHVGEKRFPAKSQGGNWIEEGQEVVIVGQDAVGMLVRERASPPQDHSEHLR